MGRIRALDYATPGSRRPRKSQPGELVCFLKLISYLTVAAAGSCVVSLVVSVIIDHFMH